MKKKDNINLLCTIISEYMAINITGGSLHIVLDDGNKRRSDIEFCKKFAEDINDSYGELIASELLKLNDSERDYILNNYDLISAGVSDEDIKKLD